MIFPATIPKKIIDRRSFIFRSLLTLTFIFILALPQAKGAKDRTRPSTKKEALFNFSNSSTDKKLSRELNSFIRGLKSYRYTNLNIKNMLFYLNKTTAFLELVPTIKWSARLAKMTPKSKDFYKKCSNRVADSYFEKRLVKTTLDYCNRRFLQQITDKKNRFNTVQLKHLTENIDVLLSKSHRNIFANFLTIVKENPFHFQSISTVINNYYVGNFESPTGEILQNININEELTTFIQNNGIDLKTSKKYFTSEFSKIIREARRHTRSGNYKDSETKFSQAISFYFANKQYISGVYAWRKLTYSAEDYTESKEFKLAHRAFKKIHSVSINSYKDKSLFNLLMNSIKSNKTYMIQQTLDEFKFLENFSKHSLKVRFWIAKALKKTGDEKTAYYLYEKISNESSLRYYSILASRELSLRNKIKNIGEIIPSRTIANTYHSPIKQKSLHPSLQRRLKRLNLWVDLQMDGFIEAETQDILELKPFQVFRSEVTQSSFGKEEFKKFMFKELIGLYNYRGKYLQSFKLVYKAIDSHTYDLNDKNLKVLFPFRYVKKIQQYSGEIDPILVLSLIRQESAFNPNAKSHAGARGLMQLMPATARRYKRRVGAHQLKNPNLNIKIGIKYLKKLIKQYDGNLIYTLSAYNAGERRVSQWMEHAFSFDDPLLAIESIPFQETRNYVKLIYRNMFFYKFLAKRLDLDKPIKETFVINI